MSEQQKRTRNTEKTAETQTEAKVTPQQAERRNTDKVDKLISEIDEVLEENAEEFVRSYVQKGGQ
ncbi:MAG: ubiquitin-like protein Pup [Actinomycetota bacterium]